MRWPLYLVLILCSLHNTIAKYAWKKSVRRRQLEDTPLLEFQTELSFHANESYVDRRTEVIYLGRHDCIEARFRVEGKRTRLRVYTCHMATGGICSMDMYRSDTGAHFCHQFHAWYKMPQPYSLYVQIERRPRRFKDMEAERHYKRRRRGRAATRSVAEFEFTGQKKCSQTCKQDVDDDTGFTTQLPQWV
ncbi:unnamed protein product [Bursaphelenchus okinawaensis]|uniref:Uncharacterized protein n=1 Tax=Bursaphelenchus okinawaensis TaxID=465554 RepID=A0A811K0V7_9BILA|nr:unnamed protein product [Bursaphelenchus okinawaensis]CAG9088524.1 unnamed protein product [Bursaphelenchus okinawaensis]